QTASVEKRHIAASVDHRRRIITKPDFEAARIGLVGPTKHPHRTGLPAVHGLGELEPPAQKTPQAVGFDDARAGCDPILRVGIQKTGRFTPTFTKPPRQLLVLTKTEGVHPI